MAVNAKTIQIFLPDGEPRGIRIAEITTRIVQAVQVPRARLDRIMQRAELDHIGAYILFGDSSEGAKPLAYIGQTEDLRARLRNHHANKEFWNTAVLLISRTHSFTLAHIRYLEWYALKQATEAGRYVLDNGNAASRPFVTEPIEADVLDAFETAGILLAALGFPLFEPVAGKPRTDGDRVTFTCSGPDARGTGRLVEDGFVVLQGSLVRATSVPSAHRYIATRRQKLISDGVLIPEGPLSLRFTEDYLFESPSGAAMLILGRTSNGWNDWKAPDGRTLGEVEGREALTGASPENSDRPSPE